MTASLLMSASDTGMVAGRTVHHIHRAYLPRVENLGNYGPPSKCTGMGGYGPIRGGPSDPTDRNIRVDLAEHLRSILPALRETNSSSLRHTRHCRRAAVAPVRLICTCGMIPGGRPGGRPPEGTAGSFVMSRGGGGGGAFSTAARTSGCGLSSTGDIMLCGTCSGARRPFDLSSSPTLSGTAGTDLHTRTHRLSSTAPGAATCTCLPRAVCKTVQAPCERRYAANRLVRPAGNLSVPCHCALSCTQILARAQPELEKTGASGACVVQIIQ